MSQPGPIPYRFDVTHSTSAVHEAYDSLDDGEETGQIVTVAGRVMLLRDQGKLAFAELRDSSGPIQLFVLSKVVDDFAGFTGLDLGDWIGATGEVVKTRRGELSIKLHTFTLLARAERNFGDKWHGINDPDLRYRQRYADLWANEGSREVFQARSKIMSLTRRWLEERDFVEVETPVFHPISGGAHARPFTTHHNALDTELSLRIAPELYLKRLVVGGFERVFEIARVFRNEGLSTRHNPEFTMLELYQAYADYSDVMELTEQLVAHLATELHGTTELTYQGRDLDLTAPWRRASMIELIEDAIGVRLDVRMDLAEIRAIATDHGVPFEESWGQGKLILEIYEKTTEADLWGPIFVTDYPQEVSPLARTHREIPGLTERFEAIVAGRELLNAFTELQDPAEQRARFTDQVAQKEAGDAEAMAVDEDYLRALEYGLPPTAGLGIGMDRLVMLLTDRSSVRDVLLFPTLRPEHNDPPSDPAT
ncbi:MAG TPA: lysine--tRNA ligase [Acidimicrobiales bacterium]|nr:lysine--tRNA ligase [Acidimicrobiales bacterium]